MDTDQILSLSVFIRVHLVFICGLRLFQICLAPIWKISFRPLQERF